MTPERIRIKVAEAMPEDCAVRFTAKVKLGTGKQKAPRFADRY